MGNQNSSCNCVKIQSKSKIKQSAVIQVMNNEFHVQGSFNFEKQSTFQKLEIASSQFCLSSGIGLQYSPVIMRLLAFKNDNVFKAFKKLSRQKRIQFIDKIGDIDLDLMDSLYQNLILNRDQRKLINLISFEHVEACEGLNTEKLQIEDKINLINKGKNLLNSSKVAIVFMCAGSSSRFFYQDKFLSPLQLYPQQQPTEILALLFKRLRENWQFSKSNSEQLIDIPLIIIGNESNTEHIEEYLKQHNFFNFKKDKIYFSDIQSTPILNEEGKICLNFEYNYLRRPKGSAQYVQEVIHQKAFVILQKIGVQYLHFVGSQNLAQSPGDPLFLGLIHTLKRQIAIKCIDFDWQFDNFDKIIKTKERVHILNKQQFQQLNKGKDIFDAPIALNSMIFTLKSLPKIMLSYNNQLYQKNGFSLYRYNQITEHIYDYTQEKPVINNKCYSFQKDIKDIISFTRLPLVVKVPSTQFIPLITPKAQFSVQEACQKYRKNYNFRKKINEVQQFLLRHSLKMQSKTYNSNQIPSRKREKRIVEIQQQKHSNLNSV